MWCIDFPLIIALGPFFRSSFQNFQNFQNSLDFEMQAGGNCLCALKVIRVDLIPENPGKSVEIAEL